VNGKTDGVIVYFTAALDRRTNQSAAVDIEIRCVEP
jgi:hypothetical protein